MRRHRQLRKGVAAVEFAILLPFLAFMFVVAVDWCRIFYYSVTVTNCARNGALYLSDPIAKAASPYNNVTAAALADAANLSPTPTVSSYTGTDTNGAYVDVTVSYSFDTVTKFPGVPSVNTVSRTVRMYVAPRTPN
jgi:Flp pilus assembly protein TadG